QLAGREQVQYMAVLLHEIMALAKRVSHDDRADWRVLAGERQGMAQKGQPGLGLGRGAAESKLQTPFRTVIQGINASLRAQPVEQTGGFLGAPQGEVAGAPVIAALHGPLRTAAAAVNDLHQVRTVY